ncbi:hypothetical protein CCICO_08020 [Corynebacterium ciconiae DSM 44920]|uniref:phage integrase central domain-containing protein n=1 Tax=Corynebacterium ciconiae TaxID=227319 RepID=UPI0012EAE0D8|nr:hypothetical protein [Corynebacterium ciconiae]WKD61620.1 hypothetical protein CCICO_08020 [Corynebacterium ciconiae DSM 44920]
MTATASSKSAAHRELMGRLKNRHHAATGGALTSAMPVGELVRRHLAAREGIATQTRRQYEHILRTHICPTMGDVQLGELRPATLAAALATMPRSAAMTARSILIQALATAVEQGVIDTNPAAQLSKPRKPAAVEVAYLTPSELRNLRERISDWQAG